MSDTLENLKAKLTKPTLDYIVARLAGSMTPLNCCQIVHPEGTCFQYMRHKFITLFSGIIKMQIMVFLIPQLGRRYNKLTKENVTKVLKMFIC